ncbi:MAG TPA: phage holin family protein [Thermoanaerobaculia bacterium]|jgi:CHASE3 domain sensor protein|nr:phage holin family protein [Thermoanaerobaculia bacterium]
MQPLRDDRSLGQILRDLRDETSQLLRQEVDLAKTEMSEKMSRLGTNMGSVATGGAVLFAGALVLLAALTLGLIALFSQFMDRDVAMWLAPLLVGGVLAFIGYGMVKKALQALKQEGIAPQRTTQSLKENKEWLTAKMK